MNRSGVRWLLLAVGAVIVLSSSLPTRADEVYGRKGQWDVTLFTGWVTSNTLDSKSQDSLGTLEEELEIKDSALIGIRADAHIGDHVAFGMSFGYTRPDFELQVEQAGMKDSVSGDLALNFIDADLTWRFRKQPTTPFLMLGIGAFNAADKEVDGVYYSEQHFQYHGAVGMEWVVKDRVVINASVRAVMTEMDYWPDNLMFLEAVVGVGYRWGPHLKDAYR
jgi:hypothetical protein